MINASAAFDTAIKSQFREIRAYLLFNGTTMFRGADGLISAEVTQNIMSEERFCIGDATTSYCEASWFNAPAGVSLKSSYFDLYIGVVLGYSQFQKPAGSIEDDLAIVEYVKVGRYFITDVKKDGLTTSVTGYDILYRLNKQYVCTVMPRDTGYPVSEIIADVFTQCGIPYTGTYGSGMLVPDVFDGTCRQTLGWLANIISNKGANWRVSPETNEPELWEYTSEASGYTAYTIDEVTTYEQGLDTKPDFTISSIVTGTEGNPITVGNGVGVNFNNPYIDQAQAEAIYANLNGVTFTPVSITWRGDPRLESGEVVKLTQGGTDHRIIFMERRLTFNGGLQENVECYGDTEAQYELSESPTQAKVETVSNALREMADRIENGEKGVITKIYDSDGNWSELIIANQMDLSQATSVWRWNVNGLGHSNSYTGGTYNFLLDDQGRLNASMILTGILADPNGKYSLNMATGEVNMASAHITGGDININTGSDTTSTIVLNGTTRKLTVQPSILRVEYTNGVHRTVDISPALGFRLFDDNGAIASVLPSAALNLGGSGNGGVLGKVYLSDTADNQRTQLLTTGLNFVNTIGTVTASYPSSVTVASYTPTFGWSGGGTAPTVSNIDAHYRQQGNLIQVYMRFQITDLGTGTGYLSISYPFSTNLKTAYGAPPLCELYGDTRTTHPLIVRAATSSFLVAAGAGGAYASSEMTTGYYSFSAVLMTEGEWA